MDEAAECEIDRLRSEPATERGELPPSAPPPRLRRRLVTADGVDIEAAYAGRSDHVHAPPALVLAHGFTGALDRPALARAARLLSRYASVVTFSFRGHGRSGGRSTVGDLEVHDLAAAVAWARELGHERVATVGFSMGGSVVLRHGALVGTDERTGADAVVAVSAPARWYYRGTPSMRRLHFAVQHPLGRLVSRYGLGTRVRAGDWDPVPLPPVAAAPLVAPTPLLLVHGDRDPYFPLDHPCSLAEAASPDHTELWIEPDFGHAENAASAPLLHRIGEWATLHTAAEPRADAAAASRRGHDGRPRTDAVPGNHTD